MSYLMHLTPEQVRELLLGFTAFVTLAALFWKQLRSIFKGIYDLTKIVVNFFAAFSKTQKLVAEIHHQVFPNDGGSIFDSVHRIENVLSRGAARDTARFNLDEVAMWETNKNGEVVSVNRRFADLVGRHVEDVMGSNWKNSVHPDDIASVSMKWASVVADQRDSVIYYRVERPDGTAIPVVARGEVMVNPKGELIGWYGTLCPVPAKNEAPSMQVSKQPHVLMVEDSDETREVFKLGLGLYFKMAMASSGRDAVQQFMDAQQQGCPFDIIVTDYAMPGMDGLETIEKIRERETALNPVPIVFFTGNPKQVENDKAKQLGVMEVWDKPLNSTEIAGKISRLLGRIS